MKEFRMSFRLHTLTVDTDGHIALDDNALLSGIVGCGLQLQMEMILNIIDKRTLISRELRVVCTPKGIRFEPILISLKPRLELFRIERLLPTFGKNCSDVLTLDTLHPLIVGIAQCIQFLLLPSEGRHPRLVLQRPECLEIQILRMKGKGRDDVIGIRVAPGMSTGRIIDRQNLYHLHPRSHSPVNEQAQVAEVADTTRVGTTQREHGNHHAGSPPCLFLHS